MDSRKQLDLGSGSQPRQQDGYEAVGVDIAPNDNPLVKLADFALQPLPYPDDSFDLVTAFDVLEHIPKVIYMQLPGATGQVISRRNCLIELFNEVYRVLKDGGEFFFALPKAGTTQYWGDPTHISEWCEDSVNYYSGDYFGHHDTYGHTSKFQKVSVDVDPQFSWRMSVRLRAVKPAGEPYNV